jgi:predicted O-methyltransferase YrrM
LNPEAEFMTCDITDEYFGNDTAVDGVKTIIGESLHVLEGYPDGHFDAIFLDGQHSGEYIIHEFKLAEQKTKLGGLIFIHDVLNVHTPDELSLVEYIKAYPKSLQVIILPTSDNCGLAVVQRQTEDWYSLHVEKPTPEPIITPS